jgi:pyruvate/2-oxoacid:ferredoxin oxidoreductase alpha subunit
MSDRLLMMGNDAIGEGAIRAGCDAYFGYPITPQNELTAYMAAHMPAHGRVFIQAESELAAINMVFGAAVAGKRAMTSSSSPGISLKQEGISYLAGAELPAVIVNVMRGGPGLGNIGPSQAEIRWEERQTDDCEVLLIAYGSCARIAKGCLAHARAAGIKAGLLRPITLWPYPYARVRELAGRVRAMLVIEMSAGQMIDDVRLAVEGRVPVHFTGRTGGNVPEESAVLQAIRQAGGAS